jgi:hypothetical protein
MAGALPLGDAVAQQVCDFGGVADGEDLESRGAPAGDSSG